MIVVQKMMKTLMIINAYSCWSVRMNEMATPMTHMMTTLYTLIPMYFESFKAGIVTCRVSHARKHPNAYKPPNQLILNSFLLNTFNIASVISSRCIPYHKNAFEGVIHSQVDSHVLRHTETNLRFDQVIVFYILLQKHEITFASFSYAY